MRQRELIANMQPNATHAMAAALACMCMLLPQPVRAQSDSSSGNRALKTAVAKLVRDTGIKSGDPGIAVLAIKGGRVLMMEGYGLANLASKEAITACTRFELASVSKSMTATAVLILQERGLLSIDDDVRKFIPELPRYANGPLRIRDMLRHISGLTDYLQLESVPKSNKSYWINADYLGALGKAPLDFAIGQKYEYNNTNYMLMAILIERAAKKPFGEVLRDEIFVPAGMKNTFVHSGPGSIPANSAPPCNNAIGYEKDDGEWAASWGLPPAFREADHLEVGDGAIWSNLEDLAKWDTALRTNALIKPTTMKLALTGSAKNEGYSLGWQLYHEDDGSLYGYGHDGYWEGFTTMYYNYLTGKHSVVLLSNRGNTIDLDKFWDKLSGLIDTHAKD